MNLLLDTCTFLWLAADHPRLSERARAACRSTGNLVYLSSLSVWEIAVKHRLGRLPLPDSPERYVVDRRQRMAIRPLPFDEKAATHESVLPLLHRDPFDRGLVSQAILGGMAIVTPDEILARYPAPLLW